MCVSGPQHRRYGGNTTCFDLPLDVDRHLIVDAGTGLRSLERALEPDRSYEFVILLTHYHWDHIQGLPVFLPIYDRRHRFTIYGPRRDDRGVGDVLNSVLRPPWFPVSIREAAAGVVFKDLDGPIDLGPVHVTHSRLHHPQGSTGFRLQVGPRSIVIATDHEAGDAEADRRLTTLADGATVMIHDGQYLVAQQEGPRSGWGHSSWDQAVRAAERASVSRLVLTSHDPDRTDDEIDGIVREARRRFPMTSAAFEGLTIRL